MLDQFIGMESMRGAREEADRILAGDIAFLAGSENSFLRAFCPASRSNLSQPNVIVDHHCGAYIHPMGNARITFDKGLHTGLNCMALFDRDIFTMGEGPGVIPEIKGDHFLSQTIRGLFPSKIRPRISVGKFVIWKKYYKYNNWEDN